MTQPSHYDVYLLTSPDVGDVLEHALERYQVTAYTLPRVPTFLAMTQQGVGNGVAVAVIDGRIRQDTEIWPLIKHVREYGVVAAVIATGNVAVDQQVTATGVALIEPASPDVMADQIAGLIRAPLRVSRHTTLIAIGGAKGGIGKSLVTTGLADTLAMRGLKVLVVDTDVANASVGTAYKTPPMVPPYLRIIDDPTNQTGFSPRALAECVYTVREPWGELDLLLATDRNVPSAIDIQLHGSHGWEGLLQSLRRIHEAGRLYDVILFDTGPDVKRRPYPFLIARAGGWVVIPALPGPNEQVGTMTMLELMRQTPLPDQNQDTSSRAMVVCIEPERGSYLTLDRLIPTIQTHWPHVPILGTIPRAPSLVTYVAAQPSYQSAVASYPAHPFSRAFHAIAEQIAAITGITLPRPAPRTSWWERLQARFRSLPSPSAGANAPVPSSEGGVS